MEDGEEGWNEDWEEQRPRPGGRVIVHLDLDCFYAQVEMLRNPELRGRPVGVQQKSLVVTCNYEAREVGIGKLMDVRDAKEKCPQLILVNGEDLTPYREMSYKVTELLREFCPLVERLGLDENFVDVTELVGKRFQELEQSGNSQIHVRGHVYNQQGLNLEDPTHVRLILGSRVAQEFREAIKSRLGLTGCAGVASKKFLAKLVSGIFKPDQQTLLLPESHQDLLSSLDHIQKMPGIGSRTSQRLEALGVRQVGELQAFPAALLEKEFGFSMARRLQRLSRGEDDSQVIPSGPPQSFSDEDSFKKCSSEAEAKAKMTELLPDLLDRISKDGRHPRTVRLSIRQFSPAEKCARRECRQCPLPAHLIPKVGKGDRDVIPALVDILLKLLGKMLNVAFPFHLTLLSICFSNLKEIPARKGSISFYLRREAPSGSGKRPLGRDAGGEGSSPWNRDGGAAETGRIPEEEGNGGKTAGIPGFPWPLSPGDAPREASGATSEGKEAGIAFSPDVDPKVFWELPADVQEELLAEWKKREAGAGTCLEKSPGKAQSRKRRRDSGMSSQSNSLLRYFKRR